MAKDNDCIFCKLANGDIPTNLLYENDLAAAFADANPQAPVHVLVVPKDHYANIIDGIPADVLAAMVDAVDHVARERGLDKTGFRTIMNTGEAAGQTVNHVHMHILGGTSLGEGLL